MKTYIWDIETNWLEDGPEPAVEKVRQITSAVVEHLQTGERWYFYEGPPIEGFPRKGDPYWDLLNCLREADLIVSHNGLSFDEPVLRHFTSEDAELPKHFDTLVGTRLQLPKVQQYDFRILDRGFPGSLVGKHTLAAWGHRLKVLKGEFVAPETEDKSVWERVSAKLLEYNAQDVEVTKAVFLWLMGREWPKESFKIEHEFAIHLERSMQIGVGFFDQQANELVAKLETAQTEIETKLREELPPGVKMWLTEKRREFRCKEVPLNFNSRPQMAAALYARYGWQPYEYNKDGSPKFDKETLAMIPVSKVPLIQEIRDYYKTADVLGSLMYGDKALIKHSVYRGSEMGYRVFGRIIHNGTRTGRCAHQIVANIPRVGSTWGQELRELFGPRPGWDFVGVDMSGIEARGIAHYLEPFDGGALIDRVLTGDIHQQNFEMLREYGVRTRQDAKNSLYAVCYGALGKRVGLMNGVSEAAGEEIRLALRTRCIPKLDRLIALVTSEYRSEGHVVGLDGRRLIPGDGSSAFNTKVQGFGALVMKLATMLLHDRAAKMFARDAWAMVIHYHDEYESECRPEIAEELLNLKIQCIVDAGELLGIKCPLTGEGKIGKNWAEVH